MQFEVKTMTRSHWLASDHGGISKEELFPILIASDVPRVKEPVQCEFSADRYRHSSGWSEWRVYLKDARPVEGGYFDKVAGIGEKTHRTISDAGAEVILAWLNGPEYPAARQRAAAHMVSRIITDNRPTADYSIKSAREALAKHRHELTDEDAANLSAALDNLAEASRLLEAVPA